MVTLIFKKAKSWIKHTGIAALVVIIKANSMAADRSEIDFGSFLNQHDMLWDRTPNRWEVAPYTGNGNVGFLFYQAKGEARNVISIYVGRHGQFQEWLVDWDNPEDQHSHVSHLYGLYPSSQINRRDTPKLFDAARISLIQRGDAGRWPTWPNKVTSEATQNPTQQMSELSRKESHVVCESAFCDEKRGLATQCKARMGPVGFEPTTNGL